MAPTIEQLNRCQYSEDERLRWWLLEALVAGGAKVDSKVKGHLLANPHKTERDAYEARKKAAPYVPILGGILMKVQSQITAKEPVYLGSDDPFWDEVFFKEGGITAKKDSPRCSFQTFLQDGILQALTHGQAIAVVDVPDVGEVQSLAQQRSLGGDQPYVQLRPIKDLWESEVDENGFRFAKLHSATMVRDSWLSEATLQHRFLIYERDGGMIYVSRYQATVLLREGQQLTPEDYIKVPDTAEISVIKEREPIFYINAGNSNIVRFPVVTMTLPEPLRLADQLFDTQVSFFNQTAAVEWAILSTNYAQLIFQDVLDEDELAERINGRAGNGYFWALPEGVKATWLERDGAGIDRGREYRKELKAEMLEIVQQVAANATLYQRTHASGESKKEDRRALDILLEVYGHRLRQFASEILNVAAIAHGENVTWTVNGFDHYDGDTLQDDLQQLVSVTGVVDSPTLRREGQKAIAARAVHELGLPEEIRQQISDEIAESPYRLTDEQRENLRKLNSEGKLSEKGLFEILIKAGELPSDFDVDEELERTGLNYDPETEEEDNQIEGGGNAPDPSPDEGINNAGGPGDSLEGGEGAD